MGKFKDEYHIISMYCDQVTTAEMLDWYFEIASQVGDVVPVYFYIEYPWIDEPLKLEIEKANKRHGKAIHPVADPRKKNLINTTV